MMKLINCTAAGALFVLAAQPCLAADDMRAVGNVERGTAAFAGASVKMPLGSRSAAKPSARLQLGMRHVYRDPAGRSPSQVRQVGLIELGSPGGARPALFVGGRNMTDVKRNRGLVGTTGTLLFAAGIAIGAYAAYELFLDDDNDTKPAN